MVALTSPGPRKKDGKERGDGEKERNERRLINASYSKNFKGTSWNLTKLDVSCLPILPPPLVYPKTNNVMEIRKEFSKT